MASVSYSSAPRDNTIGYEHIDECLHGLTLPSIFAFVLSLFLSPTASLFTIQELLFLVRNLGFEQLISSSKFELPA